jgi:uncharacterized protein (DUF924 family)
MNDTNSPLDPRAADLLQTWFGDALQGGAALRARMPWWFGSDAARDADLHARFGALVDAASSGGSAEWSATPRGRLARILLLDQLPRNCFRGQPRAFATDAAALRETMDGLARGDDLALFPAERLFFYMPMQHAEDAAVQESSVAYYERLAAGASAYDRAVYADAADFARVHRDIVRRFGRFPHRNAILGRATTPEEREWLAAGAPDFGQK